jgi:hypothetical protein
MVFTFCGGGRLTTTLGPNVEKEICKALHVQMDVGNTINIVIVQRLMINIMTLRTLVY